MREVLRRLRVLFDQRRFDRDLDEEVRDHLRRKAAEGGDEIDARRQFGNVTLVMEESRGMWQFAWLEQIGQDVRYSIRSMMANKLFTAMAVLSLALGIGANTAIYSFMDAVMLRALPVDHPDQLVILNWRQKGDGQGGVVYGHWGNDYDEAGGTRTSPNYPYAAYELLRTRTDVLSTLFGHASAGRVNLVVDGVAGLVEGQFVTGNFFSGAAVGTVLGRTLGQDDDGPGATPVAVLTYDYWQTRFGGDPKVIGKTVGIRDNSFTVVGVAVPDFYGVAPGARPGIFIPMALIGLVDWRPNWDASFRDEHFYWIELMGRLQPGVSRETAEARMAGPFHNFVAHTATNERERANLPSLWLQEGGSGVDGLRRAYSKPIWILTAMVGMILLIACANVANLMLARASRRKREMAVRLSLGAGRFRIVRQLLTESILLALTGAIGGVGVGAIGIRVLLSMMTQGDDPFAVNVGIDWRALTFTLSISVATGILFGLAPALQATRADVAPALKETHGSDAVYEKNRRRIPFGLSHVLVVAQIAISLLLVTGAGLFVRTLANLRAVQLGFNAENMLTFRVDATQAGFKDAALKRFYSDLQARLRTMPGTRGVTSTDMPLVNGWNSQITIDVPGIPKPTEGQRGPTTALTRVGPSFFEAMEIPIIAGRALEERDSEGGQPVVVVNQVFADKYFPGQNPLGRHFKMGYKADAVDVEIVGVAKTVRYSSLKRAIPPVSYLPWSQAARNQPVREMFYEVRAMGEPLALANSVRQIVREASPLVPVEGLITQQARIDQTIRQERTFAKLCSVFAGLALVMACIGLYGTMAYAVARRTSEIGIRMALGAVRGRIIWMVLREVIVLSAIGVAIGFAGVYEGMAFVKSLLFGLRPSDPLALLLSSSILLGCALLAGFLPARRASRIDPIVALRHE